MNLRTRIGIVATLATFFLATPALADTTLGGTSADEAYVFAGNNNSVGIGTKEPVTALDVPGGEIRPGNSGKPCTAKNEGAIRYADNTLQFCGSKGWRIIQSIGPGDQP